VQPDIGLAFTPTQFGYRWRNLFVNAPGVTYAREVSKQSMGTTDMPFPRCLRTVNQNAYSGSFFVPERSSEFVPGLRQQTFIRIDLKNPIAARVLERLVACRGEIINPGECVRLNAKLVQYFESFVIRARIDDDYFVHQVSHTF